MNEAKAQELIILATFVTIGSTSAAEFKGIPAAKKLHPSRTIIGGFFAMLGCSVIAEFSPQLGLSFAALVSGAAFFIYGLPSLESAGWFQGEARSPQFAGQTSPIGHPGKKIVGTQVQWTRAGGPVEVPIYRSK